ncbi:MAG TPA: DUF899 family protein [Solirubrobacteraceae bacterium]|jgi:predicted dithiol-disulfide oxidoreductase (DUF899 family)|nr:DUF899 family protein [Solirubrobacteraceae bacterium]
MAHPHVASREEWVVARKRLLAKEKELTRARDGLSAERRRLPVTPSALTRAHRHAFPSLAPSTAIASLG